jgi:quinol monooxygenase YgiN
VLERWTTREALKAHATAAHVLAYQAKVKDWIETRMVHVMSPV